MAKNLGSSELVLDDAEDNRRRQKEIQRALKRQNFTLNQLNFDELELYGRAESPYNPDYLTAPFGSGSSNGSGTALAASLCAFALAEETWSSGRGGSAWAGTGCRCACRTPMSPWCGP